MFSRSQLLFKRLAFHHSFKALKTSYPTCNTPFQWFSKKNLKNFIQIPSYSFSASNQKFTQAEYHQDLTLLSGESSESLSQMRDLLGLYSKLDDPIYLPSNDREIISNIFFRLVQAHRERGNFDKALRYSKEVGDLYKGAGLKDDFNLAVSYFLTSSILMDAGRPTEGEPEMIEVDRICGLYADNAGAKALRVQGWGNLAQVYTIKRDYDRALSFCNSALERIDDVQNEVKSHVLGGVYGSMGMIYRIRNDLDKAIDYWTKALDSTINHFGEGSPQAFQLSDLITRTLYAQKLDQRTLQAVKKHVGIALKAFPKDSVQVADAYQMLGTLQLFDEKYAEALISYEEALKFYEKLPQDNRENLGAIYFQYVRILGILYDSKKIASLLPKIERWKSLKPQDNNLIFEIYQTLGRITYENKDWSRAYGLLKECEKIANESKIYYNGVHELDMDLSLVCTALEKFDEAENYLQKIWGPMKHGQMTGQIYQMLAGGYEKAGLFKQAGEFYKNAVEEYLKMGESKGDPAIQRLLNKIPEMENKEKETAK